MSMFQKLAALLGVREDQVDDALRSEQRARIQLTRRGLLAAAGAAVVGQLLPPVGRVWSLPGAVPFVIPAWPAYKVQWSTSSWLFIKKLHRAEQVQLRILEKMGFP